MRSTARTSLVLLAGISCMMPSRGGTQPDFDPGRFDYDLRKAPSSAETLLVEQSDLSVYDVVYESPKDGSVTATLVVPKGPGPFAAILFGHWGYGTRTEFLAEAKLAAREGAVCLLPDNPWVRPAPWRRNVDDLEHPERDLAVYTQAVVDLRRGLDLLLSLPEVDRSRIAYVGHSYGAQWGAILSAVEDRLHAAVLMAGIPDLGSIWLESKDPTFVRLREQLPQGMIERYVEVNGALDAVRYVAQSRIPLYFQFARYERYFDRPAMERYFAAAREPKRISWYDTGHELNDPQALADRFSWLRDQIGLRPAQPGR